jgi:hypothetical protein
MLGAVHLAYTSMYWSFPFILNGYFQVALGIWWDSNSPSWPTSNISGDTVPNNYQNYGADIQWTIYQAWFEIYDRY